MLNWQKVRLQQIIVFKFLQKTITSWNIGTRDCPFNVTASTDLRIGNNLIEIIIQCQQCNAILLIIKFSISILFKHQVIPTLELRNFVIHPCNALHLMYPQRDITRQFDFLIIYNSSPNIHFDRVLAVHLTHSMQISPTLVSTVLLTVALSKKEYFDK